MNILHTVFLVLPVIIINFTDGAIAHYIYQQEQVNSSLYLLTRTG